MSHRLDDDPVRLFHEVGQLILYPAIAYKNARTVVWAWISGRDMISAAGRLLYDIYDAIIDINNDNLLIYFKLWHRVLL